VNEKKNKTERYLQFISALCLVSIFKQLGNFFDTAEPLCHPQTRGPAGDCFPWGFIVVVVDQRNGPWVVGEGGSWFDNCSRW
jgi:hypothetical protein